LEVVMSGTPSGASDLGAGVRWPPRRIAAAAGAAAVALLVLLGQLVDDQAIGMSDVLLTAAIGVTFTPMAALVLAGVPGHLVGRLMLAAGATAGASVLAASWAGWSPLAWLTQWSGWPPLGIIALALLVFPDGRLPSRRWWWRALGVLIAAGTLVAGAALAVAAVDHPRTLLTSVGVPLTPMAQTFKTIGKVAIALVGLGFVGVLVSLALRWRRATGDARQQLLCLFPAVVLFALALVLEAMNVTGAWMVAAAAVPVAMTLAVLRYRLYDLDRIIHRTTVWLVMSLLLIIAFVAIVAVLRAIFLEVSASNASLLATGLIAVAFEPVRRHVQHGVDHLIFGDRHDPYKVIAGLADLQRQTTDPDALLPLFASAVARSMRAPYVAVEGAERDGPHILAEYGRRDAKVEDFDMIAHGERVGRLLVGPRRTGGRFTSRERRLLADVAQYAAVVTQATRLIRDLRQSRERLIKAREEERRRLRHDLHDSVGPALVGMAMQVRAAQKSAHEPERVGRLLDEIVGDLQLCTAEVRQLLDDLHRPPELDRGLEAALRAQCRRFDGTELTVDLQVARNLEGLPAATEVAAYRIVAEALSNVTKHARAQTCTVTVERDRWLGIRIIDDGVGFACGDGGQAGVGLESMRRRAAELGGECVVTRGGTRGTTVRVQLPVFLG
jgi:two-component system, NarL family, sensor kinase